VLEKELTNPEPLQIRHVSGLVPGGTPAPSGKKEAHVSGNYNSQNNHYLQNQVTKKNCIYILQVSHGTVV
jgi:hypothetical protein